MADVTKDLASESQPASPHSGASAAGDDVGDEAFNPVPTWARELPCVLLAPLTFFRFSLNRPGDSFLTSLRKNVIGVFPLIFVVLVLLTASKVKSRGVAGTAGGVMSAFAQLVSGSSYLASWVLAKCSPEREAAAVDIGLAGTAASLTLTVVSDVAYPVWGPASQLAFITISMRSPRAVVLLPACAALCLLSMYNAALLVPADGEPDGLAAVPGAVIARDLTSRFSTVLTVFIIYCVTIGIVEAQMREAARRTAASKASADLAAGVADALARYDTDAAHAQVEAARDDGLAESALLGKFDAIVDNLKRYRPHLPNWLVRRKGDSSDDPDAERRSGLDDDCESVALSRISRRSGASSRGSRRSASRRRPGSESTSLHSSTIAGAPSSGSPTAPALDALSGGTSQRLRVTFAEVAFEIGNAAVGTIVPRDQVVAAGHAFVDRVHKLASSTNGAVHSFVGDVVRVSWNAAAKAVQPEAKAARFLARLKQDPGHELVELSAAAAHGDARVQLAGSAGQQKALLVTPLFGKALRSAAALAAKYSTVVVDGSITVNASHAVAFRGVGLAPVPEEAGRKRRGQFELLAEHQEGTDEWLYVLDRREGGKDGQASTHPAAALTNAVELLTAETADYNVAYAAAAPVLDTTVGASPIVAAFIQRLRDAAAAPSPAAAAEYFA